jgi:3-phytase
LTSFILAEAGVDGVEETDGLDLVTMPLNDTFRQGLLVVQDGFNTEGGIPTSQNFKFVSFERLSVLF